MIQDTFWKLLTNNQRYIRECDYICVRITRGTGTIDVKDILGKLVVGNRVILVPGDVLLGLINSVTVWSLLTDIRTASLFYLQWILHVEHEELHPNRNSRRPPLLIDRRARFYNKLRVYNRLYPFVSLAETHSAKYKKKYS